MEPSLDAFPLPAGNTTNYWNKKYSSMKQVWGGEPSTAAYHAANYLASHRKKGGRLLDLGCGYGRDSIYFSEEGYSVTGIDTSSEAIRLARSTFPDQHFVNMDFRDNTFPEHCFSYIFANFFFHLITDRVVRLQISVDCHKLLAPAGLLFASLSSIKDQDYSNGIQVGPNLVKNSRDVVKVFYDEELINRDFCHFNIIDIFSFSENHTHDKPHSHENYMVIAERREFYPHVTKAIAS